MQIRWRSLSMGTLLFLTSFFLANSLIAATATKSSSVKTSSKSTAKSSGIKSLLKSKAIQMIPRTQQNSSNNNTSSDDLAEDLSNAMSSYAESDYNILDHLKTLLGTENVSEDNLEIVSTLSDTDMIDGSISSERVLSGWFYELYNLKKFPVLSNTYEDDPLFNSTSPEATSTVADITLVAKNSGTEYYVVEYYIKQYDKADAEFQFTLNDNVVGSRNIPKSTSYPQISERVFSDILAISKSPGGSYAEVYDLKLTVNSDAYFSSNFIVLWRIK